MKVTTITGNKTDEIFAEKYRPQTINDIIGQPHILPYLKGFVESGSIPHLLFGGTPGTGKTTSCVALAKDLFGSDWKSYFMEINASDDRGINIVRKKIKDYARSRTTNGSYKIIFLDEADNMTPDAQDSLRRIIERYHKQCKFILSCNYPNKIIPAIRDRCSTFRFRKIKSEDMMDTLKKIVSNENIDIDKSGIETISELSGGSMRRALTTLHTLKLGRIQNITRKTIQEITAYVNEDDVIKLFGFIGKKDIKTINNQIDKLLSYYCYEPLELLTHFYNLINKSKLLSDKKKIDALLKLGDVEYRISQKSSADLQLRLFVMYLTSLYE